MLWSSPASSIVTGNVAHLATHSSFHGSFPPSNGETLPRWGLHPLAHSTRFGLQTYSTVFPVVVRALHRPDAASAVLADHLKRQPSHRPVGVGDFSL